jgi:glycosyltransferase involved in cell wall biosynthesis
MKVLFFASYFPKPDNPQMGTWALTQAQALIRQGIDIQIVSFTSWVPALVAITRGAKAYSYCPESHQWSNIIAQYPRWLYYPVFPLKQPAYVNPEPHLQIATWSARKRLQEIITFYQPDLFFIHHSLPNGWVINQLSSRYKRPFIVQEHDFDEIADCHLYQRRHTAMAKVANSAYAMLAVSKRMELDMKILFPGANTYTHHNGVDLPLPKMQDCKRPLELQAKKIILVCGLFAERKGILVLIEAFQKIVHHHPDAILRIIGGGPTELQVQQAVQQFPTRHQVQLLGKKDHEEVLQEMLWADCFALVGWDEPFATVYLEAMAAGKPIICCNDGGINDVIMDGIHGYTVPPKDVDATATALDRLLSDDTKRLEMGNNAQMLIKQKLTWDIQATNLVRLFEQAIVDSTFSTSTLQ